MKVKNIRIEIPYALLPDYEPVREKIRRLTGEKEEIFKHELEACGFYRGHRVQIICNDEGLRVLPVTPYTPPKFIHRPRCRCTII